MTELLADALDRKLATGVVRVDDGDVQAEVDVTDVDRLGVSVRGLKVRAGGRGDVADQAARLPEALRVLPERLEPVEVDPTLGGAVLRSTPRPLRRGAGKEYYEARTDGHEVSLEKVRSGPKGRASVPFTLTREQLGRLVEDIGGVIGEDDGASG